MTVRSARLTVQSAARGSGVQSLLQALGRHRHVEYSHLVQGGPQSRHMEPCGTHRGSPSLGSLAIERSGSHRGAQRGLRGPWLVLIG
jgi:hypothetical protein